jgi:hypothetical protein
MGGSGVIKGFVGVMIAIVAVVVISYWTQTITILTFFGQLIAMNAKSLFLYLSQHWPFA